MSRLAWFSMFGDDFVGGTVSMNIDEVGAYALLIIAQWGSKELKALPDDPDRLKMICKGFEPTPLIRSKFTSFEIAGRPYLRNERQAREWDKAVREHDARVRGGKLRAKKPDANGGTPPTAPAPTVVPTTTPRKKSKKKELSEEEEMAAINPHCEAFEKAFEVRYQGKKYVRKAADFVQLAKTIKTQGGITLEDWSRAVANYFRTLQRSHTLADLAVNYPTFFVSALDRYNKPIGGPDATPTPSASRRNVTQRTANAALLAAKRRDETED